MYQFSSAMFTIFLPCFSAYCIVRYAPSPPNNPPPTKTQIPEPQPGDHSYCFTNFLHRFVPRQKLFKYIGIGQKLHTWQNCQQQLKIFENIKSDCFNCFNAAVDISTCSRPFRRVAEQPVFTPDGKRTYRIFSGIVRDRTVTVFEVVSRCLCDAVFAVHDNGFVELSANMSPHILRKKFTIFAGRLIVR